MKKKDIHVIKNSDVDISKNIKRIKKEERYTIILVCFFVIVTLLSIISFSKSILKSSYEDSYISGDLKIDYGRNDNGIRDSISIRYPNQVLEYDFSIYNNSDIDKKFIIYLMDDNDLIKYENCRDKIIDYKYVLFKLNDKYEDSLSRYFKDNKYIIEEANINPKDTKYYHLKIYFDKNVKEIYHYHSIIVVDEIS